MHEEPDYMYLNSMNMPQIRYFHRGRYFRPSKPLHFLPPLKLATGATHQPFPEDDGTCKKTSTRGRGRDRQHSRYRKMVTTLSSYLTLGNVADMKFLCRDHVRPPQIVDEVTNARHLFALLENQRLLAENSLYFLQTLLYYIARPDLYQIVLEFRADRQDDYKGKGVDIVDHYQVDLDEDDKRLKLASELLKFRKDLKPRRRLNEVDVNGMRRRLDELSVRMKDNIKIIQQPNASQRVCDDTTDVNSVNGDAVRQDKDREHAHKTTLRTQRTHLHTNRSPNFAPVRSFKRSGIPKTRKPLKTESVNKDPEDSQTKYQKQTEEIHVASRQELEASLTEESKDEDYYTEDEEEISVDTFGYETPCPPPRESALGVNGVKVYDDVTGNPITKYTNVKVPNPSNLDQVTNRIHKLRRQSKEQRNNSMGRIKKKKRKSKTTRTSESGLNTSRDDVGSSNADVKLPDIYDKYARQTTVQY
ncbi:uncharacterized protein LOC119740446 [Patiria miniata]|uniref:DED domain-containing protein n=1 Tax=Patiria miniata TaxID=46514 RepID=A0A914B799_PATMI|nr:uncharacterized protein LOC119740446 [Patiria miniata]